MSNVLDDMFTGHLSRRRLMEALAIPVLGAAASAQEVSPQKAQSKRKPGVTYSPDNIGGGGRIERNFYRDWTKSSKVPMVEGYSILDSKTQETHPWPEIGGRGVYLNFSGNVHMDGVILEIPSGKSLLPARKFYEQLIVCIAGRGTTIFGDGPKQNKVQWGEGSLFSVPMNVLHRHQNDDSSHPSRLLAITTFPFALNTFGSMGLINDTNFSFSDRYDGSPDFFNKTDRVEKRWDKTNFVKDIRSSEVVSWEERGAGNASMFWEMAGNTILEPHMSDFPVGSYKLGHRHPYEAIILTLNGKGFTLFGKEHLKSSDAMQLEWKAGSVVSPPYFWFHQHFNTGDTRARYFAVTEGDFPKRLGIPLEVQQIEMNQEDPDIKKRFDRERHKATAAVPHSHGHDHGHHHG
jgi:oxalate decarboxylase/phosphoglucose isomerase-like protein (cupin superfamily)